MQLRNLTLVAAAVLALAGCNSSNQDAEQQQQTDAAQASAEDAGQEPIMLHAQVEYTSTSLKQEIGDSSSKFALELQQPAFRSGRGEAATYSVDNDQPQRVIGSVHGKGHTHLVNDDSELTENYDESAVWNGPITPQQGLFTVSMPEPSAIGDGLSLNVEVHAAVAGSKTARISSKQGGADVDVTMAVPLACSGHSQYLDSRGDACGFILRLDAKPTAPKSDVGEVLFPQIQQALAAPNGEWSMAMLGGVYGAITEYRGNGHFVLTFKRKYDFSKDGSSMSQDFNVVVWSTGRNEDWRPSGLAPLKAM